MTSLAGSRPLQSDDPPAGLSRAAFYRWQAQEMLQRAQASPLPRVRDTYLQAAAKWVVLCQREREFERRGGRAA